MITVTAKTVEDAITQASLQLGVSSDRIQYEVVEKGSAGVLGGLFGSKPAVIRAKKIETVDDKAVDFLNSVFDAMGLAVDVEVKMNEEEKLEAKMDILDDPVRMYLKQMGQVSLLTREEEVAISKRIEDAEQNVQRCVHRFGFIANAYLDVAYRLLDNEERFDRVILDKKIDSRERYMKGLAQLCAQIQQSYFWTITF